MTTLNSFERNCKEAAVNNVILDFKHLYSKKEVYGYLKEMLDLSPYCRSNLDALYEELIEKTEETQIYISYQNKGDWPLGDFISQLLPILRSAEKANPRLCIILEKMN